MLWFGRITLGSRWEGATLALADETLRGLLPAACCRAYDGGGGTIYLDPATPARCTGEFEGHYARLSLSVVSSAEMGGPVAWVDVPPDDVECSYVRCEVFSRRRVETLAIAFFAMGGCYRQKELARALEISLENRRPRRGKASVLISRRLRPPHLRPLRGSDLSAPLAVFRCENPGCLSRGAEVIVRLSDVTDAWRQKFRRSRAIAYPCPGCPGSWEDRWALTWVRSHPPGTPLHSCSVVDYPIRPTRLRRVARADAMANITAMRCKVRWGSVWDSSVIGKIPSSVTRFLRRPRPESLLRAFRSNPTAAGELSAFLLTPDNLRAFIDFCRSLPVRNRGGAIATALAVAFNPRRMGKYVTEHDAHQKENAHYPYIAFLPHSFFLQLRYFKVLEHPGRFLDVGSGIGEKAFLAFALGRFAECDGLEYDPRTVAVAEFLLAAIAPQDPYPIRVFKGDALTFDRYAEYDVIYMYRPFHDATRMGWLVRRIAKQMKAGAIMFDVFQRGCSLRKAAPDEFVTATDGPDGFASWEKTIALDDFLNRHGLS